jgi:hypothetical protein
MAATLQKEAELSAIYGEQFIAQMKGMGPAMEALNREKIGYFWLAAEKASTLK